MVEEGEKERRAPARTKSVGAADDLVSVTVRKTDPKQKAGIKLVQKGGALYISHLVEGGLFDESEIEVGDKILSLNGTRLKRGETVDDFTSHLATMTDKITVVVKKANAKATSAARSLSPGAEKRRRRKLITEGNSHDREDHDQYRFHAEKLYSKQTGGLMFHKIEPNLFVSGIASDSIFKETGLAVGDRVVTVNDVNFLTYSDGKYAATLLKRGEGEVGLVVEKGWTTWDPKFTDKKHNKPTGEEPPPPVEETKERETKTESKDVGIKAPRRRASGSGEVLREEVRGKSTDRSKKPTHEEGPNGMRFLEHKGDFLCITIKKKSEKHPGIKIRESRGMFLLKKIPSYEKRVALGSRVLAINGSSFKTEEEAQDLIDRTRDKVILIIDFEQPVLQECP
eukprot:CAMPEP_0113633780 /NCGR_PEP_ID=MMETSP0017_2-20120614/17586_1 /TAXON_ID=2856 /ORGANISM="Cylindrotheca closterium" /LENGTH=396 /DNA_ID=CAMNT_0000544445 /DNA_START=149 /DNA_END=1336 /DNA_ORIENTATION=- /assembly_acc=CAM_ASM_000147